MIYKTAIFRLCVNYCTYLCANQLAQKLAAALEVGILFKLRCHGDKINTADHQEETNVGKGNITIGDYIKGHLLSGTYTFVLYT
jgi:hypothetical protein